MILDVREEKYPKPKFIVYVWDEGTGEDFTQFDTYTEEQYTEINDWCKETFGRHCRTAYNVFEFKKAKHLDWFVLKWS
jgi:hypothetical protein